jgi:hypothetical protein
VPMQRLAEALREGDALLAFLLLAVRLHGVSRER